MDCGRRNWSKCKMEGNESGVALGSLNPIEVARLLRALHILLVIVNLWLIFHYSIRFTFVRSTRRISSLNHQWPTSRITIWFRQTFLLWFSLHRNRYWLASFRFNIPKILWRWIFDYLYELNNIGSNYNHNFSTTVSLFRIKWWSRFSPKYFQRKSSKICRRKWKIVWGVWRTKELMMTEA